MAMLRRLLEWLSPREDLFDEEKVSTAVSSGVQDGLAQSHDVLAKAAYQGSRAARHLTPTRARIAATFLVGLPIAALAAGFWLGTVVPSRQVLLLPETATQRVTVEGGSSQGLLDMRGQNTRWALAGKLELKGGFGEYQVQLPISVEECTTNQELAAECDAGVIQLSPPVTLTWDEPTMVRISSSEFSSAEVTTTEQVTVDLTVVGSTVDVCFGWPATASLTIRSGGTQVHWSPTDLALVGECDDGIQLKVETPDTDPPTSGIRLSDVEELEVLASGNVVTVPDGDGTLDIGGVIQPISGGKRLVIAAPESATARMVVAPSRELSVGSPSATEILHGDNQVLPSVLDRERDLWIVLTGGLVTFWLGLLFHIIEVWPAREGE